MGNPQQDTSQGQGTNAPRQDPGGLDGLSRAVSGMSGGGGPPPLPHRVAGGFVPCPQCRSTMVKRVGFSWWGGVLGPSLFCHCKCGRCGATFNGKTGASNAGPIAAYVIISCVLVLVIVLLVFKNT